MKIKKIYFFLEGGQVGGGVGGSGGGGGAGYGWMCTKN